MESVAVNSALREELVSRGLDRVQQFRWEDTARATFEAYRSTVLHPSERSLQMRRLLRDAIIHWSEPRHRHPRQDSFPNIDDRETREPLGIRNSLRALNTSVHKRLMREMKRFQPASRQRSA